MLGVTAKAAAAEGVAPVTVVEPTVDVERAEHVEAAQFVSIFTHEAFSEKIKEFFGSESSSQKPVE